MLDIKPRITEGRRRLSAVLRASRDLVSVDDASRALGVGRLEAAKLLARWAGQGWLKRLRRGLYAPIPIEAATSEVSLTNPWVIVPRLFGPGYVGGWSAAEHWDLTEQIFRDVCAFTIKPFRRQRETIGGITFVLHRTTEDRLFGTTPLWEGQVRILISDPHRTVLDMLARPETGGGIRHVQGCLDAYLASSHRDLPKLIDYGDRLLNRAVFKRLGFLLERTSQPDAAAIEACQRRLSRGRASLDPALPSHRVVTRWRLFVPAQWMKPAAHD